MYMKDDERTQKTLIHIAAQRNQEAVIRKLHELRSNKFPDPLGAVDFMNCNALHDAAVKGNIGPLRALAELKADLTNRDSQEKKTCLHKAAEGGYVDAVKELIRLKADMNGM